MVMRAFANLLLGVALLETYCKEAKDRHFSSAKRKNQHRTVYGLLAVIASTLVTSELMTKDVLVNAMPFLGDGFAHLFKPVLSAIASVLTASITFLGLEKDVALHCAVGNRYAAIAHRARALLELNSSNSHPTEYDINQLTADLAKLREQFFRANDEGVGLFSNSRDFDNPARKARKRRKSNPTHKDSSGSDAGEARMSGADLKSVVAAMDAEWISKALENTSQSPEVPRSGPEDSSGRPA
jgi:hypothetical protein